MTFFGILICMETTLKNLSDDPGELKKFIHAMQKSWTDERQAWTDERQALQQQAEYLQEQLNLLVARRFGRSSEKYADGGGYHQLSLFDEAEELDGMEPAEEEEDTSTETVEVSGHKRKKKGRKPLPPGLPRIEVIHDLSDEEKICSIDGHTLEEIGRESSEQLDIIPAKVRVIRNIRIKYGCPHCRKGVKLTPMPPQPIPKALASAAMLAWIATSKYADALPLYRQSNILIRAGIELPRSTLANWMIRCGKLVQPLINLMRDQMLEYGVIQMDETTVQVLKEDGKKATSKSYMWVQKGGSPETPVILFDYDASRSGQVPKRLLEGYGGWLQSDGYAGYLPVSLARGMKHVGCWAHARRKFTDALKAGGKTAKAAYAVKLIRKLYAIEKRIRGEAPLKRYEVRQREVPPILKKLREWMSDLAPKVVPSSALGKGLRYLNEQWPILKRYIEDGRLEIDNNNIENAIRPFVVGRKNWLFSNSVRGATSSANLYSMIETAKANGLEPFDYLRHVFTHIPAAQTIDQFDALLPWNLNPNMTAKIKPS